MVWHRNTTYHNNPHYIALQWFTPQTRTLHGIASNFIALDYAPAHCLARQSMTYIHACAHASIHVYVHACSHACIHTHMHVCMHATVNTQIRTCVHTYRRTHVQTCMHASTSTCTRTRMHAIMHGYKYTRSVSTHMYPPATSHTYMRKCLHTHMRTHSRMHIHRIP